MKESNNKTSIGPQRRLSLWRVSLAILILGGIVSISISSWNRLKEREKESATPAFKSWFAAYVDVTSTPTYAFEQLGSTATPNAVLSFIVSSKNEPCIPSWGAYYTMDEAAVSLDLDRRIARLQQQGGKIAVSFGGALNSELSLGCVDSEKLFGAYKSVVERYNIDTVDLDLENENLVNSEAAERRAIAIAKLQNEYRNSGKNMAVWLTLPVTPQGLTQEGTNMITKMLSRGVDISGINIMTMDYGQSLQQDQKVLDASKNALIETHRQLGILYKQAGINLNSISLWRKIGATPMIGQNDFVDEIFSLEDAKDFNLFSRNQGIGRMSMWSANRDVPCGENYVDVKVVSDSCSGTKTPSFGFSQALSDGFDGDITQSASILTTEDPESNSYIIDDPERSPYQIWKETGAYPKGVKVVWHGNVYMAKWWTKNDLPDNPVLQSWQTPWQLVGPVLLGEKPIQQPTLPEGTYPNWSGKDVYDGGDRVLFDSIPFQAKWWNQGESPAASTPNPDSSPWIPLTQSQIADILEKSNKTAKE